MNTDQLRRLGKKCIGEDVFLGVFGSHQAPNLIKNKPAALIMNTQRINEEGEHWIAMFFDSKGRGRFFDSYGRRPEQLNKCWTNFMYNNANKWTCNKGIRVQEIGSNYCGLHCIMYLLFRLQNRDISDSELLKDFNDKNMGKIADTLNIDSVFV